MAQAFAGGVIDLAVTDPRRRRAGAAADAWRADHTHLGRIDDGGQVLDKLLATRQHAADGIADPDGQGRRRRIAFADDVEVIVEGSDLVDLGLRHAHILGQGAQVPRRQMPVPVLDQVEEFDQEIAASLARSQQLAHVRQSPVVDRPPLGPAVSAPTRNFSIHPRSSSTQMLKGIPRRPGSEQGRIGHEFDQASRLHGRDVLG